MRHRRCETKERDEEQQQGRQLWKITAKIKQNYANEMNCGAFIYHII